MEWMGVGQLDLGDGGWVGGWQDPKDEDLAVGRDKTRQDETRRERRDFWAGELKSQVR